MNVPDRHPATVPEPPAGVARIVRRRARRVSATFRLGHDRTARALPRIAARLLSAYERAGARIVLDTLLPDWMLPDGPVLWLARRIVFALAGRSRGDDDPSLDGAVPPSGWRGNMLALAIWAGLLAALLWTMRRWPAR